MLNAPSFIFELPLNFSPFNPPLNASSKSNPSSLIRRSSSFLSRTKTFPFNPCRHANTERCFAYGKRGRAIKSGETAGVREGRREIDERLGRLETGGCRRREIASRREARGPQRLNGWSIKGGGRPAGSHKLD